MYCGKTGKQLAVSSENRARANLLSLGVWHFTLRFVLPRSWVGYPSPRQQGCGMQLSLGPKVYPVTTVFSLLNTEAPI